MTKRSVHPYEPYVPENATKLIIGTIPPYRFCQSESTALLLKENDVNFYYGSKDNAFWKLMSELSGMNLEYKNTEEAINERKLLLSNFNTGITDMVESCVHKDGKSDDKSLLEIRTKNLSQLLLKYPKINTLIYTSKYVATLVNCYADKHYHEQWDKKHLAAFVSINRKVYSVQILYSPSPNALRKINKEARQLQYRRIFKED